MGEHRGQPAATGLVAWLRSLVPASLLSDPRLAQRATIALGLCLVAGSILAVRSVLFYLGGHIGQMAFALGGSLLMVASVVVLRLSANVVVAGNIIMIGLTLPGVRLAVAQGGLGTAGTVALALVPLMAGLVLAYRWGFLWAGVVSAAIAGIGIAEKLGWSPNVEAGPFAATLAGGVLLPFAMASVSWIYERSKDAAHQELQRAHAEKLAAEATAERLRSDRLVAMGQLVAGVAHEINNPLTYVISTLRSLREDLNDAPDERAALALSDLALIESGVERIRAIVRDLKTFTRPPESVDERVKVDEVVAACIRMVDNEVRHKSEVRVQIDAGLPKLKVREGRLAQVVLNLLLNSAQAMEPDDDNVIIVSASIRQDSSVAIAVKDNGAGMSDETRERALEPLFTTKPVGVGTGLGLSVCADIVRTWDGSLEIESEQGVGTTVTIVVPGHKTTGRSASVRPPPMAPQESVDSASEDVPKRLLIIDDDKLVARAVARMLRPNEIVIASSGEEGLTMLEQEAAFDVILCDLMMPGLSGDDVYAQIATRFPGVESKVVFLSGGVFNEKTRRFLEGISNPFVDKPVDRDTLTQAILQAQRAPQQTKRHA